MARIMIDLGDLKEDKVMELIEAIEEETGESFSDVEVSHEVFIQVDISEEGIEFC